MLYGTVLILSLTTETLMDSPLQPQGVFLCYAGISFCAIFFVYFFMGETKGLSEKERKEMFMPGRPWGRKLKEDEQEPAVSPMLTKKRAY